MGIGQEEVLKRAKSRLQKLIERDEHNRRAAIEDLKFLNGEQWDSAEKKRRADAQRPYLTLNLLPKFIAQVVGDGRLNKVAIKIRPTDTESSVGIAKIRENIIREIQYLSQADTIYENALQQVASCGYAGWRILTRYVSEESFEQEIYLEHIKNPFALYLDPEGDYGFLYEKMSLDEFKQKYPDASTSSVQSAVGVRSELWWESDSIAVIEYFEKQRSFKDTVLLSDGRVVEKAEAKEIINRSLLSPEVSGHSVPVSILKERKAEKVQVKHYILTGAEILQEQDWAGEDIPLVEVMGWIENIEGKEYRRGLIRHAKDPQRLYNYWRTLGAETIALMPKAPYVGTAEQFKGFEQDWRRANTDNLPFLIYNPDPLAPGAPQRQIPQMQSTGVLAEISHAKNDIDEAIGMFRPSYGAISNETSGRAIMARAQQADTGTYIYIDNLKRAIIKTGVILNNLIPKIYDTARDVRIKELDETEYFVPINMPLGEVRRGNGRYPQLDLASYEGMPPETMINEIGSGKYDVVATVAPSYATKRLETVEQLLNLFQTAPQASQVALDILAKNLDFPGAEELAERLRKTLPPGIVQPREGELPPQPPPPSPAEQIEMRRLEIEGLKVQLEEKKLAGEIAKTEDEIRGVVIKVLQELSS